MRIRTHFLQSDGHSLTFDEDGSSEVVRPQGDQAPFVARTMVKSRSGVNEVGA